MLGKNWKYFEIFSFFRCKTENQENDDHSDVLREIKLQPGSISSCVPNNGLFEIDSGQIFCAGGSVATSCAGDRGAGYFIYRCISCVHLIGIVSSTKITSDKSDRDIKSKAAFTNIKKYIQWIESTANFSSKICAMRNYQQYEKTYQPYFELPYFELPDIRGNIEFFEMFRWYLADLISLISLPYIRSAAIFCVLVLFVFLIRQTFPPRLPNG